MGLIGTTTQDWAWLEGPVGRRTPTPRGVCADEKVPVGVAVRLLMPRREFPEKLSSSVDFDAGGLIVSWLNVERVTVAV